MGSSNFRHGPIRRAGCDHFHSSHCRLDVRTDLWNRWIQALGWQEGMEPGDCRGKMSTSERVKWKHAH